MSEVWMKLGYNLGPQDRRIIDGIPMHNYILQQFSSEYGEKLYFVDVCNKSSVVMNFSGVERDELEAFVEKLREKLELSETSDITLIETEGMEKDRESLGGVVASAKPQIRKTQYEEWKEEQKKISEAAVNKAMRRINNLIGAEELKQLCRTIYNISFSDDKEKLKYYFSRCAVCFFVSGGDGFTEYVSAFSELLDTAGVVPLPHLQEHFEAKKNYSKEEMHACYTSCPLGNCAICMDLTYMQDEFEGEEFREFLRSIAESHKQYEKRLPVFKLPHLEEGKKQQLMDVMSMVFPVIFIEIPPFSTLDYTLFAKEKAECLGFPIADNALDELQMLIDYERRKLHFYGFKSVYKLVKEIIYEKTVRSSRNKEEQDMTLQEKDLIPLLDKNHTERFGIEELDKLVGIEDVRERLEEIIVQIQIANSMPKEERPSMHMVFMGNPGTGKTTIARLLGLMLKEKGLLSRGLFFERTGRDFVGKYIGETAPITNAICRDAYGSVLFIDEAYTLFRSKDDEKDFGREALDALLSQMENHRQDLVVIMAGYPEEMELMLDANPGLRSRIPYKISFRNYKQDELAKIYMEMAKKKYTCAEGLEEAVEGFFGSISEEALKEKSFANARYVRNLFERTVTKAGMRLQAMGMDHFEEGVKLELTAADFIRATESEEFAKMQEKKRSIGFV